jgi:hypothetical protein
MSQLLPASDGFGPLLQRDYWAVIRNCRLRPSEVVRLVLQRFREFAPAELCEFHRSDRSERELEVGAELDIHVRLAGNCRVRVLHLDSNSFTLGTLAGHPEAGRITFGCYRNDRGDVVFQIRSRARSSSAANYAGFIALGEAMQTGTWTDFVDRVAATTGEGVLAQVHAETRVLSGETARSEELSMLPTFIAQGAEGD